MLYIRHLIDRTNIEWLREKFGLSNKVFIDCGYLYCAYANSKRKTVEDIEMFLQEWEPIFCEVAVHLGYAKTRRGARYLYRDMMYDKNWKHLWLTDDEEDNDYITIFDEALYDILYCSDRWGYARLHRIQWTIGVIYDKAIKEGAYRA